MSQPGFAFTVSHEVRDAVDAGRPVVALESTIFTQGLPRPRNLVVAREAERQLRDAGVVPATIGVVDGQATVGLSDTQIERLSEDDTSVKISSRDLPMVSAKKHSGGTTVAGTTFLAHRSGIRVFATGGIGGVHHGAASDFDESADLVALASTPMTVVSAGAKSILDIPATLERMETLNIPVVGYRTRQFPGFYVTDSGYSVEYTADTPHEIAAMTTARDELKLPSALLVGNPVPPEEQLAPELHDKVLADAWEAAKRQHIAGHRVTPFLVDYLVRATEGRSLEVNTAIYRNNISLAAKISQALSD